MKELGYFVYQIYPKSFLDTTGNGIGDINGIRSKLTYIKDLGFDYAWITPMYMSPQKDNGYDVADYMKIDPIFGTEEDFDNLILEADKLGLKIMMDVVFNHCSTEHIWFKKAVAGDKYYQDYFIWRDQPTNWESKFGGNAWEYEPSVGKYYLHLFDKTQADLNWENENVRNEAYDIVNYWIKRGVKGFRFDVINLISKHYPIVDSKGDGRDQYTDGPRIHEFLQELKANTFAGNDEILTVGEMSSTSIDECISYAGSDRLELDSVFHFHHLKVDYEEGYKWSSDYFDFEMLANLLKDWQEAMQEANVVDTLFWSCHDQPRIASRFIPARNREEQLRKNKTVAMMMYLMRGISYIYQGEELGMENLVFESIDDAVDVESINYYNLNSEVSNEGRLRALSQKSRDNARTPVQWTSEGGFTNGTPWIKYNDNTNIINAESQMSDDEATRSFYKQLISLKKNDEVLIKGKIDFNNTNKLFKYTRTFDNKEYTVVVNLWDQELEIDGSVNEAIINNNCSFNQEIITLPPFSAILYK